MTLRRSLLLAPFAAAALPAAAQEAFPTRPVRIIVPFTPGGQTDTIARLLAARLQTIWRLPVTVDNRAGANGLLGIEAMVRGAPDGYTLATITLTHAINATLVTSPPYDFAREVAPLCLLGSLPLVAVVPVASPVRSFAELVAAARSRNLNGGSSGTGTPPHLALELFRRETGAGDRITHVPYRGGAPAITDLVAGTLDVIIANLPEAIGQIQGGRLRPLAVTTRERHRLLPEVPTTAEVGMPGLELGSWTAIAAPAAVAAPLRGRIAADSQAAIQDPEASGRATEIGFDILAWPQDRTAAFVVAETARLGRIIREANIRAES
jgi:tripartite-type tricarboxylate transporter receptor subunit TctC